MTSDPRAPKGQGKREHASLLRLQRRLLTHIERLRDELAAPSTTALLRQLRHDAASRVADRTPTIKGAIEEAIRALKVWGSEIQDEMLVSGHDDSFTTLVGGLPPSLARFLAERQESADCRIDVLHDPDRGWIIRWKEYTHEGTLRGGGRLSERPYAWLDD
ncbi:MAG: hypothetical protein HY704_11665 [Gemmatimonadetes bacterium]|nr:hypothetical protein [Gemmatimonadota bacterium]